MKKNNTKSSHHLTECLSTLSKSNLQCDEKALASLIHDFGADLFTLKLLANYLNYFYAGQLNGLATIPCLHNKEGQQQPLQRLLSAFQNQLHGSAELTLLYMLSLSKDPVYQQHMVAKLHKTWLQKLLQRKSEYQQFLRPLSKLNAQNWEVVINKLHALDLLNLSTADQGKLLSLAKPVRDFFQQNWQIKKFRIIKDALHDMDTIATQAESVNTQNKPADKPHPLGLVDKPEQPTKSLAPPVIIWKKEKDIDLALKQLGALRSSLNTLNQHTHEIKHLLQPQTPEQTEHKNAVLPQTNYVA